MSPTHITYIASVAAACSMAVDSGIHGVLAAGCINVTIDSIEMLQIITFCQSSHPRLARVSEGVKHCLLIRTLCHLPLTVAIPFHIISVAILQDFKGHRVCTTSQVCQHQNGWWEGAGGRGLVGGGW